MISFACSMICKLWLNKAMEEQYRFIENTSDEKSFAYVVYDKISSFTHKMGSSQLLQIYYILDGEGAFVQIDKKKKLTKGDLLFVNPFEESGFETEKDRSMTFIGFGVEKKEFAFVSGHDYAVILKTKGKLAQPLIEHIYALMREGEIAIANQYFAAYIKEVEKEIALQEAPVSLSKEQVLAKRIKDYLDDHLLEQVTISSMASHFYCSSSSLFHCFKKVEGMTIIEYLQTKRLEFAKYFLRTSNRKIADICNDVGFSSTQFFYSYFLKKEGMTPNEYRLLHQEKQKEN